MRKRVIEKGNIHRSDHLRALVTDTLPGEVPIIFSNDGLYSNLKAQSIGNSDADDFIAAVLKPSKPYTKPYRYKVIKQGISTRGLSLIHPGSQVAVSDLYMEFGKLICYFCNKSEYSIRSPKKVGSLFFVRDTVSDKNIAKGSGIDTVDIESSVSNPASYFSYSGYDRAYKFFESNDYMHLEKRYPVMRFADVSKCFNSIYTHTLFWAIADIETAKDNTRSVGFCNAFDKLMQSMNYNETNGICIGPEVSRVFSELIFSEIDHQTRLSLRLNDRVADGSFAIRRYVDDYYIFASNNSTADRVQATIEASLEVFNLHFNAKKTETYHRPFVTQKSRVIADANTVLEDFFAKFIQQDRLAATPENPNPRSFLRPKTIWRTDALARFFIKSIKNTCYDNNVGYDFISNYVVAAMARRVNLIISGYHVANGAEAETAEHYADAIHLIIELVYFFYTVNPTVASSLKVAKCVLEASDFMKHACPQKIPNFVEHLIRWTIDLSRSMAKSSVHEDVSAIPIEILNVIIPLAEIADHEIVATQLIDTLCAGIDRFEYFEIISFLFCLKKFPSLDGLVDRLVERANVIINGSKGLTVDSQAAHLAMDLIACPTISPVIRSNLLASMRGSVGLPPISEAKLASTVAAFEERPWFTNWSKTDLLSLIRKKELSAVY